MRLTPGLSAGVSALVVDPERPSAVYAGTSAAGVWFIRQVKTCPGDCNRDGEVTINEVVTGMNFLLDTLPATDCFLSFERNGDAFVTVDELIVAVNAALSGCPPGSY